MLSAPLNKKRPLGRIAGATRPKDSGCGNAFLTARYQNDLVGLQGQDEARTQQVMRLTPARPRRRDRALYLGSQLHHGGPMPRTLLTGLVLISLAACGGGSGGRRARPEAKASAASRSTAAKPGTAAKRKTAARSDTTGQRNPLTN